MLALIQLAFGLIFFFLQFSDKIVEGGGGESRAVLNSHEKVRIRNLPCFSKYPEFFGDPLCLRNKEASVFLIISLIFRHCKIPP